MGKPDSPILEILRKYEVEIPDEILHPSNFNKTHYYDLIGFVSQKHSISLGNTQSCSGSYGFYQQVYRDSDLSTYSKSQSFERHINLRRGGIEN